MASGDLNGDGELDVVATNFSSDEISIYVNTTAPDTTIVSGPGATSDQTPTFAFSADEIGVSFECRVVDVTAFAACVDPFTTPVLPDGLHTFEVRATDPAGNTDATPASRAFTISSDITAPETTITSGPRGIVADLKPTFRFSSSETGSTFECRVDSAAFASCSPPFTTARLRPRRHRFEVRATDAAGNSDASPARRSFTAVFRIVSPIASVWRFGATSTSVSRLAAKQVPRRARVQVRCRGGGCPFARKAVKTNRRRVANATRLFRGRRLRPGAVVEVRVTARFAIGKVRRFRIRSGKLPKLTELCLRPGARRPKRC